MKASPVLMILIAGALMLGGCVVQGDFGRTEPSVMGERLGFHPNSHVPGYASPNIHELPYTADETELRSRAYALTYTRAHNKTHPHWSSFDPLIPQRLHREGFPNADAYAQSITGAGFRSPEARLNAIIDDIRADLVQIDAFGEAAKRVFAVDGGRLRDLERLTAAPEPEVRVTARVEENQQIVEQTLAALDERIAGYEMALGETVLVAGRSQRATARNELVNIQQRTARLHADLRRLDERYVLTAPPPPDCLDRSIVRSC